MSNPTISGAQDGDEALKTFLDAQDRHQAFVEATLEAAALASGFRIGGLPTPPVTRLQANLESLGNTGWSIRPLKDDSFTNPVQILVAPVAIHVQTPDRWFF